VRPDRFGLRVLEDLLALEDLWVKRRRSLGDVMNLVDVHDYAAWADLVEDGGVQFHGSSWSSR
jgi:hypothetical protein